MRSEGYGSCPVCLCVCPRPSSATGATQRQSRHTGGLSIVFASVSILRFSYNRFLAKLDIRATRSATNPPFYRLNFFARAFIFSARAYHGELT